MNISLSTIRSGGDIEMEQAMAAKPKSGLPRKIIRVAMRPGKGVILVAFFVLCTALAVNAAVAADQQTFATPEEAAKTLIEAAKNYDTAALLAIFGPGSEQLVSSGDAVSDKAGAERFAAKAAEMMRLDETSAGREVLSIGPDNWPFPIPIVKKGDSWVFDTEAGAQEILDRRVGGNELNTIDVLHAYVEAQRMYASQDRDGSGVLKFARKLGSSEGKHDGLYWPASSTEDVSPLGPLVAEAVAEGYTRQQSGPIPYHGYYFRILTAQGKHAPGGAYSYIINGNMIAGFAMIAFPANYGASGVMTFMVNQQGIVYQKDLGLKTKELAEATKSYDPDSTWKKAE
jgi:hypothetical protein